MKEIIILRGLPFSGKTTWAEKFKSRREDSVLFNIEEIIDSLSPTYTRSDRWMVVKNMLIKQLQENDVIVINGINILTSSIYRIFDILQSYKLIYKETIVVQIKEFHTPYELCMKRAERCNADESLLKRMKHYYNHCLRRKIIYKNEEDS